MPPETAQPRASIGSDRWRLSVGDVGVLRLRIYAFAFGVAFLLYVLIQGISEGLGFWIAGGAIATGLLVGISGSRAILRLSVAAGCLLALTIPLAREMANGMTMEAILRSSSVWPQTLVALFASRTLAEECDQRFAAFWRSPTTPHTPVELQSGVAAFALGAFLTLLFYQTIWWILPTRSKETTFSAIVTNALTGETVIHRGLILLFFVIIAYLFEAALRQQRDRAAFRQIQMLQRASAHGGANAIDALRKSIVERVPHLAHLRIVRLLESACDSSSGTISSERRMADASFEAFHASTRRFLRGLLPFLPMLGFFGTVVGLATAMASLPTSSPEGSGVDISGSLAGLAVKFQTTLLGIMGSLVASGLLAFLEKRETELAAECTLFVATLDNAR